MSEQIKPGECVMGEVVSLRKSPEWEQGGSGNHVLQMDDCFVSFIERPNNPFDSLIVSDQNRNRPETALVWYDESARFGKRHFILYGDWREAYTKAAPGGFAACYGVFASHLGLKSETSDEPLEITP